ncbi:MAG: GatB/YqeY domain-containing protein [Synergistaceae bacterium]|nr:GatB/YqeY domain-containing protein [Synergistaceae bacterium]
MACPLTEKIQTDLVSALKNRDDTTLSVLRMLKSSIQIASTEKGRSGDLTDEDVLVLIRRAVKQREEAADLYKAGGAMDRAAGELEEARILIGYLPAQMDDAELEGIISGVIKETGVSEAKDVGRIMSKAMQLVSGKADGRRVRETALKLLG